MGIIQGGNTSNEEELKKMRASYEMEAEKNKKLN
jgi:hypothetical protein